MRRAFLFTLIAVVACGDLARADALKPPFDPALPRQIAGRSADAPFRCAPVAPPTLDMSGLESRYAKDDPTQSRIDPASAAREAARGKVLWDYVMQIGRMADQFMLSNPPRQEIADCVVQHLATWARANALTGNIEQNHEIGRHQAIMLQAWSLAGLAFAHMKLGNRPAGEDTRRWFRTLSDSVVKEYSDRNRWSQRRSHNHALWAGLAAASAGIVLNDKGKVDFGVGILRDGLAAVAADGSLPEEMARGERALLYQHFATMGIVGLVAIADANGHALNNAQQQALARLLRFDIEASRKAGAGTALPKHVDKSALAWTEIAVCYLGNKDPALAGEIDAYARSLRPLVHVYYGGNATAAFNAAALPGARDTARQCLK